ncbi:protein spire homolog 1-like isoform X2 [Clavelina lepadiformis]|uniref:protein spire homolog 1-like isoform X2 n=1 Tax=Clavelina lepadiformis TaxID=159417 RepID=UPI00404141BD
MNLLDILLCFDLPLKEEQAWAVCHQCGKFLKEKFRTNKLQFYASLGVESIVFDDTGHVSVELKEGENNLEVLKSLGLTLFSALDYGLGPDEEQELSTSLEHLISFMTEETPPNDNVDEGFDDCKAQGTNMLDYVIQLCEEHLPSTANVDGHYQAVCRALVNEARELKVFLDKVASANESLKKDSLENKSDSEETPQYPSLNFVNWSHLWIQVLDDLRLGVTKLRKVEKRTVSIEYELTPYEILMEDIRRKKYTLKKVSSNDVLPALKKKNAHDIILDFIRSRPNLSPAHKRVLKPTPPRSKSLHEKLIEQIQERSVPLKPVSPAQSCMKCSKTFGDLSETGKGEEGISSSQSRRKLLKAPTIDELYIDDDVSEPDLMLDDSIAVDLYVTDSDANFNISSSEQFSRSSDPSSLRSSGTSGVSSLLEEESDAPMPVHRPLSIRFSDSIRRKRLLPLELPPSPVSTPVQSEEAPDSNTSTIGTFLSSFLPGSTGLRRSQSVAIRSTRGKEHSSISAEIRRQRCRAGGRKADESLSASMHTTSTSLNDPSTAPPFKRTFSERRSKQESWRHPVECLSLTIDEIMHIRQVLTRAQLERFQSSKSMYDVLKNEKICFHCRLKKFGLFSWPYTCQICRRKVCSKCIKKIRPPTEKYLHAPLFTLSPDLIRSESNSINMKEASNLFRPVSSKSTQNFQEQDAVSTTSQMWSRGSKIDVCIECHVLISGVINSNRETALKYVSSKAG